MDATCKGRVRKERGGKGMGRARKEGKDWDGEDLLDLLSLGKFLSYTTASK